MAQVRPAPGIDWRQITWYDERPEWGQDIHLVSTTPLTYSFSASNGQLQEQEESGEEWYYGHANVVSGGNTIGYAVAGYSQWQNWQYADAGGCFSAIDVPGISGPVDPEEKELESLGHLKSTSAATVGLHGVDGAALWAETYFPGTFYGVAAGNDGNSILAVGEIAGNRTTNDPATTHVVKYNPDGIGNDVISDIDCSVTTQYADWRGKMVVMKVDLEGEVQWIHAYGEASDPVEAWPLQSRGQSIVGAVVNGNLGYVVVGYGKSEVGEDDRAFIVRIDEDGLLVDKHMYLTGSSELGFLNIGTDDEVRLLAVDQMMDGTTQHLYLAGSLRNNGSSPALTRAFAMIIDPESGSGPFTPVDHAYTLESPFTATHSSALTQYTTGGGFADDNGVPVVLWPVLSDYDPTTDTPAGRSIATLKVHKLFLDMTLDWTATLHEVRAYDLQSDLCQTSDGDIAVLSTTWSEPYSSGDPFDWNDLTDNTQDCLDANYSGGDTDWPTSNIYDYWNTDAYVAKLDMGDGSLLWETTFDAEPDVAAGCFPDNMKKQECMYKISEAPDGGLVLSGNTGNNFDDNYLAKLMPDCQGRADYTDYEAMDGWNAADNEYVVVDGGEVWTTDMNVHGVVRVPGEETLTITNGAKIQFADSKLLDHPTRIVVDPGGTLVVDGSAKLTNLTGCPRAMWDGILLRGAPQGTQHGTGHPEEGLAELGVATIENARMGVLVANEFVEEDVMADLDKYSSGGIVQATGTDFSNNQRDVVFSPYENHVLGDPGAISSNRSWFKLCTFGVNSTLADARLRPGPRARLFGIRGVGFYGCTLGNYGPYPVENNGSLELSDAFAGKGIEALNSSFWVKGHCDGPVPPEGCDPGDLTRSSFHGFVRGVVASTFDLSRTFIVDETDFDQCLGSIRMEGIQDAGITRNTFLVGEPPVGDLATYTPPYGVYSDQCTGYEIEENAFTAESGEYAKAGLVIKDSGPYYNTYYNNTFDGFAEKNSCANVIMGENAGTDKNSGLEPRCNDYGQTAKNSFDIALTGAYVSVQVLQGLPMTLPTDYTNPAGNRFSTDHDGSVDPEEDWFVEDGSTDVEYFYHTPTLGNRTKPEYADPDHLTPTDVFSIWPGKVIACPSHLSQGQEKSEEKLIAQAEDEEFNTSKDAYDAAKDNGDTYTLVGYVSDPSHSSAQARNALQSVAPKASAEAFQAAFERVPAMSAWHITQALLSNSPLQSEVLKLMYASGLPAAYISLVEGAQSGEVNVLTLLQSDMALHAGNKANALVDLGRDSWLDAEDVEVALDSLKRFHEELPSDNSALARSGVLLATQQYSDLEELAQDEAMNSGSPELFELIERYAAAEQAGGWAAPGSADLAWLVDLGAQRGAAGSAQASAWLRALGNAPQDEIVFLPLDERSLAQNQGTATTGRWNADPFMEAYPNPTSGPVYIVYNVPEGVYSTNLRIVDISGREVSSLFVGNTIGIAEVETSGWIPGLYLAELRFDGLVAASAKVCVQR